MKSRPVDKTTVASHVAPKVSGVKKSKNVVKPVISQKSRMKKSLVNLRSQDLTDLKKKPASIPKGVAKSSAPRTAKSGGVANAIKQQKVKEKKIAAKKKTVLSKKETAKVEAKKKKVSLPTTKMKTKQNEKAKSKKKEANQRDITQFIELWSLASIGKREASLNATMKVNIMYERQASPKKSSSAGSSPIKSSPSPNKASPDLKKSISVSSKASNSSGKKDGSPSMNSSGKKDGSPSMKESKESTGKGKKVIATKNSTDKPESSKKKVTDGRKRKSQYKIYEDEPTAKSRKKDKDKNAKAKPKKPVKTPKKKGKTSVLGHHLGNIIEKSPRQASLNAKAMIAMEQEDDILIEGAARTKIYDWMEVRSTVVSDTRKMIWVTGLGDLKSLAQSNKTKDSNSKNASASLSIGDLVDANMVQDETSYSLHGTLLKTIHEIGDARLLKEFFRSQKEDFPGDVDIERCPTPEPPPSPVKEPTPPPPKKKCTTPHSSPVKKTPEKQIVKPIVSSPAKPKPCRVATPIPQFASNQRPGHISSFIHHPAAQTIFQNPDQHQKQPQPIKVTPYAPSSAYVYQYSPDRPQQNIFVPNTPSPMQFGADTSDLVQRNFPGTFSFNQIGSLSFERRGLNPYHHPQGNAYNPSMHLPIQPTIGFNFQQFYQPSLQQLHSQQNLPSIQAVPLAHQQYPLVPPTVMQQPHTLGPNMNPIRTYPSTFQQYPVPSTEIKQDKSCMPPPSCPVAQSLPQESPMTSIVQPLPSYRRAIPIGPQVQSHKLLKPSPERLCTNSSPSNLTPTSSSAFNPQSQNHQKLNNKGDSKNVIIHNPQPLRPPAAINLSFRPICKKETESVPQHCDKVSAPRTVDSPKKVPVGNLRASEESSMSDILHSAHSTMFSAEEKNANVSIAPTCSKQTLIVTPSNSIASKVSQVMTVLTSSKSSDNFNGSYSVSSILEMPNYKVKAEPKTKSCAVNTDQSCHPDQKNKVTKKETYYICIPPKMNGKPGTSLLTTTAIPLKENFPLKLPEKNPLPLELSVKQFPHDNKVIVIDDSDSSDDEPLAKLVQSKPNETLNKPKVVENEPPRSKSVKSTSKALKVKLFEKKTKLKSVKNKELKTKLSLKSCKENNDSSKLFTELKSKQSKNQNIKPKKSDECSTGKMTAIAKQLVKKDKGLKEAAKAISDVSPVSVDNSESALLPAKKSGPETVKKVRRKSKCQAIIPPILPKVKATHGWTWVGDGEWKMIPKVTQQREEPLRLRKSYTSMKHQLGEIISVKDCVILQSDGDGMVPYVGKVSALWENTNGDMMFSMLWYYQPEHTATGREPEDGEQELFASKHREENSVACIDDKCYVLMYNEFCRMEADAIRQELGLSTPRSHQVIPDLSQEDRGFLRPLPPLDICAENIWFCRYDYDIRKKIVRKPKHKKSDLRYRGPCKLVQ